MMVRTFWTLLMVRLFLEMKTTKAEKMPENYEPDTEDKKGIREDKLIL